MGNASFAIVYAVFVEALEGERLRDLLDCGRARERTILNTSSVMREIV